MVQRQPKIIVDKENAGQIVAGNATTTIKKTVKKSSSESAPIQKFNAEKKDMIRQREGEARGGNTVLGPRTRKGKQKAEIKEGPEKERTSICECISQRKPCKEETNILRN